MKIIYKATATKVLIATKARASARNFTYRPIMIRIR